MSRMRLKDTAPEPYSALAEAVLAIRKGPLEPTLQELVRIRASQLNGCAFCIDQHTRAAHALGVTDERIEELGHWSDASSFNAAERAALAYAEAATRADDVPDDLWNTLKEQFADDELGHLVLLVALINAYNRIGIPLRMRPLAPVK